MIIEPYGPVIQFRCEYCGAHEVIKSSVVHRGFMTKFNRFRRQHDWKCKANHEHQQRIRNAEDMMKNAITRAKVTA